MNQIIRCTAISVFFLLLQLRPGFTQSIGPSGANSLDSSEVIPVEPAVHVQPSISPDRQPQRRRVGFAVKASLLGAGFEAATPLTTRINLRAGFNIFRYDRSFENGIRYDGRLTFNTMELHYDFFPRSGSFHISPGILIYLGQPISASAAVPGGQFFTMDGQLSYSDPASPIAGHGKISFHRFAPMITAGWGNLMSRNPHRRFSIPVEFGIAYLGRPHADFRLSGTICDSPGDSCRNIATDPDVQSGLISGQEKLNRSLSFFRVYPIISVGFGYKF